MNNPWLEYASRLGAPASGGLIPQHVVDQIRDVLPPSAVIGKHVRLRKAGREWKGLSPFNQERTPSFFVNDDKRFWHDFSSNQSGDVFAYFVRAQGMAFREAVRICADMAGISLPAAGADAHGAAPMSAEAMAKTAAAREERQRAELEQEAAREIRMSNLAKSIARDCRAFTPGDGSPPSLFLVGRGLEIMADASPRALLYHPACPFRDDADNEVFYPALIGLYRDILTDRVMAISRRPLTPYGQSLSKPVSLGPTRGCVIKLTPDEAVCQGLHLAEGITSALAATMLGMVPIWATGGTGNMAKFPVLAGIDALTIIADNDKSGAGQAAANECFDRWKNAGKEVWNVISDTPGTDIGDVVLARDSVIKGKAR